MAITQTRSASASSSGVEPAHRRVIFASSLGTVFEWYDFYLYGALSIIISKQFFSGVNETTGFIFALLAFAAGFFVRPFGALVFGRLGDLVGRKRTFLITIVLMGVSTALVGLLPNYATIGVAAPIILIVLRVTRSSVVHAHMTRVCDAFDVWFSNPDAGWTAEMSPRFEGVTMKQVMCDV